MSALKVHGPEGEHKAIKGTSCKTLGSGGDYGEVKTSLLLERGTPAAHLGHCQHKEMCMKWGQCFKGSGQTTFCDVLTLTVGI